MFGKPEWAGCTGKASVGALGRSGCPTPDLRLSRNRQVVTAAVWRLILACGITLCLLATSSVLGQTGDIRLLFFTSSHCPPCRQMEPVIDAFINAQYPISKVNTERPSDWVQQFRISQTPTAVMLVNGQEIRRHSGVLSQDELVQWFTAAKQLDARSGNVSASAANEERALQSSTASPDERKTSWDSPGTPQQISNQLRDFNSSAAELGQAQRGQAERGQTELSRGNPPADPSTMWHGTREISSDAEAVAMNATVRLRVEDATGFSFATGTIIHSTYDGALVVTCGHVFRESAGRGVITCEWNWNQDRQVTFPGTLIQYDSERADVALVAIQTDRRLPVAPLASPVVSLANEQSVFSLGCDQGEPPTIRHSRLKRAAVYNRAKKFDIYGRPVIGRSGGGLFTAEGKLIGVCNAAVVDDDEGIYSSIENVHAMLQRSQLASLFEPATEPSAERFATAAVQSPKNGDNARVDRDGAMQIAADNQTQPLRGAAERGMFLMLEESEGLMAAPSSQPLSTVNAAWSNGSLVARENRADASRMHQPQINTASFEQPHANSRGENATDGGWEAIVILRNRQQPEQTETFVVDEPSSELMEYLGTLRPVPASRADTKRMAQLREAMPQVAPQIGGNSSRTRAQSPR